jgi:hypothetical protein
LDKFLQSDMLVLFGWLASWLVGWFGLVGLVWLVWLAGLVWLVWFGLAGWVG